MHMTKACTSVVIHNGVWETSRLQYMYMHVENDYTVWLFHDYLILG